MAAGSVALVVAALAVGELLLRWSAPGYLDSRPALSLDRLHRYSEVYGWELRPGARQFSGTHWTTINHRGYRGPEVGPEPMPGRARIVMLGDSITFGTYVGDGETFADRLQESDAFEVVNLSVQGYGLGQSLLKLEREGLHYRPHAVVLNVCLANDFADTMLPTFLYDARHPKPYFRLQRGRLVLHDEHLRLGTLQRLGRGLREHSHLYNRVLDRVGPRAAQAVPEQAAGEWVSRRAEALRNARAARRLGLGVVARMRAVAETHGAEFVIALHPDKAAFKHGSEWIDAFYAEPVLAGLTIVDLGREYRRAGLPGTELMLDGLGHLSPFGHRQAAALLHESLLRASRAALARGRAPEVPRG